MRRVLEPDELMDEAEQAAAYAASDFTESHELFVTQFATSFPDFRTGRVADLCCGPADPTIRFARRYPEAQITGYDGAESMLAIGKRAVEAAGLADRVILKQRMLPLSGEEEKFEVVLCNGSMHHFPDPAILWQTVKNIGTPGTLVYVRDLLRPATPRAAKAMVALCSKPSDPDLMKRDLHNSLLAAFRPEEVQEHLAAAGLGHFRIQTTSAHLMISGMLR